MTTKLLYLENMQLTTCNAHVTQVIKEEQNIVVLLNQTIFYPQGGGQPYDTGVIKNGSTKFIVQEVRFRDGIVYHTGTLEGNPFAPGSAVTCEIDAARRALHTRLHSAGHIVDMALKKLGVSWKAGKGYHFPQGPYVEYSGSITDVEIEKFKPELEAVCNEIVASNIKTQLRFTENRTTDSKPERIVLYGDFSVPCGGTHVENLKEVGKITIRKIKQERENIRVAYSVE